MAESLLVSGETKEEKYRTLLPQTEALVVHETDLVAALANLAAALHHTFDWLWTGFYLVKNGELVLGPFQGPIACTRIGFGKGVCGAAWQQNRTLVVPDVDAFPGHIACSSLSRSEVVVPLRNAAGDVVGVLDVDATAPGQFDETDARYLEAIVASLTHLFTA
ncbi:MULTISPECIES: GAF domain-containing protein [Gulbenkiania]|uniref:GAF domain-containing protein n=2 Tax=Gulbenkiania TaxID=397456 RepID=A0ABY2CVT9_GULMO|nr:MULTISPECIES: GAF domain-containing protein [Gulbenkiania]TCW31373.1 GAF domain-containing protein [Gulbenkiania mobilis]